MFAKQILKYALTNLDLKMSTLKNINKRDDVNKMLETSDPPAPAQSDSGEKQTVIPRTTARRISATARRILATARRTHDSKPVESSCQSLAR